jgi:MarR family transcriptional regulator, transcriptional regulator for hemolysin
MRDLDNTIGFLFHDVARFRSVVYDHFMQPYGLTRAQWRVLGALFRKDGLTQRELCDRLELGAVTLSGLIDRLEAQGWAQRREDPKDRRVKRVWLTDQVRDIQDTMNGRANELNRMALKGLSRQQIDDLVNMLKLVKGNLMTAAEKIQENKNGSA